MHRRDLPPELPMLGAPAREAKENDGVQRSQREPHVRVPVPLRRGVVGDDQALRYFN